MRGRSDDQANLFHVFNVEDRIRPDHPLRDIKRRADLLLERLAARFAQAYSAIGRPSVPPERLLKALLLMALYSVRSERQLCERIDTDLLFRWFLDLSPGDDAFDPTTFTPNRARLAAHGLTEAFFDAVVDEALTCGLCSEHFSVDGTLIESFASAKSFQPIAAAPTSTAADDDEPKSGGASSSCSSHASSPKSSSPKSSSPKSSSPKSSSPKSSSPKSSARSNRFKPRDVEVDFHGQKRTNETHCSQTDPEARLYRKSPGQEAKLAHLGHALGENRHGLVLAVAATEANGTAERTAALAMLDDFQRRHGRKPTTLGSDKGYDAGPYYRGVEERGVEPHGAMVERELRSVDASRPNDRADAEARHRMKARQQGLGYSLSQRCRKKLEEAFGWMKAIGGLDRSRVVGRWKLQQLLELGAAAYNLVRLRKLAPMA